MFAGLKVLFVSGVLESLRAFKQKNDNERINIHHFNYISM